MKKSYYLSIEQRGIIRRIPLQEEDLDIKGILDAIIKIYCLINEPDERLIDKEDLIQDIRRIDSIYIEYVETYENDIQLIEQRIPMGETLITLEALVDMVIES